ncbi:radical SAM protein [Desulforhopalus sp. IMCC35007]|uniref:radical SAM protein n=1 Tax=Desulforhopalus sp. IMCC35007 TaxID=2569543 RepID=UPI0010AE8099|nr:radical SAM protein [Desulforhopalus sp. IMCC35007]TKB06686.1 radical SAM protein [Desulforhopalus sp. IMCC35007]
MNYPIELGPIRPVDEADSLLIRTTRNCPWNRCEFCVNYQGERFSVRSVQEIKNDIDTAAHYFNGHPFTSCFLQDGDSLIMKTGDLLEILDYLKKRFPTLITISSYGRAWSISRKSLEELQEICSAGLNMLYCGMESGSAAVLETMKKGVTPREIISAGIQAKQAGIFLSEFVISGLGGTRHWQEHASSTALALNEINPDKIRVLTIGVKNGSGLEKKLLAGEYCLQTEENIIEEQKLMLKNLNGVTSHYAHHHGIDLLIEVRGKLPEEKDRLLSILDRFLNLPENEKLNFILGRRLGLYNCLNDLRDTGRYDAVEEQFRKLKLTRRDELETLFHSLRAKVV